MCFQTNTFSLEKLREATTAASFVIMDKETGEFEEPNDFDSRHFYRYGFLNIAIQMTASLIILNNTIVGMEADDLQTMFENTTIFNDDEEKRQVIVVGRDDNEYRELFVGKEHMHIECTTVDGQNIIEQNIISP